MFWDTPIPEIELAFEGRVDFLKKTNPWRSSDDDQPEESEPSQDDAGETLFAMLRRMQHKQQKSA